MLPSERRKFVGAHRTCVLGYARKDDGPAESVFCYFPTDRSDLLVDTMGAQAMAKAVERLSRVSILELDEKWPMGNLHVYCNAVVDHDLGVVIDVMMAVTDRMSG